MPLVRLMKDQTTRLNAIGCKAVHMTSEEDCSAIIENSEISHVFTSPETLMEIMKPQLLSLPLSKKNRFRYIFVDESHCIVKWGQASAKNLAFRAHYDNIGAMRSILPEAAIIAMTATATAVVGKKITESLGLTDPVIIRASPERKNIRYSVVKTHSKDIPDAFKWLSEHIEEKGFGATRMLIFCRMLHHISSIYEYISFHHGKEIVQMYHKKMPTSVQDKVAQDFSNPLSKLRIIVCSSSFSMGLDIPELHYIVHYGMSADIDQYVQEAGRVGRDGAPSHACVIYHRASNTGKNMTGESKAYVKSTECRRALLISYFGQQTPSLPASSHDCCDNCTASCPCGLPNHDGSKSLLEHWFSTECSASFSDSSGGESHGSADLNLSSDSQ